MAKNEDVNKLYPSGNFQVVLKANNEGIYFIYFYFFFKLIKTQNSISSWRKRKWIQ